MKKITIEELKNDLRDWEWFPLEYILGDAFVMQFGFVGYEEDSGMFIYRNGFTGKDLILALDNVKDEKYTVVTSYMFGKDLAELDGERENEPHEEGGLYEVPVWLALEYCFVGSEDTEGHSPGIPLVPLDEKMYDGELEDTYGHECTDCGACGKNDDKEEDEDDSIKINGEYLN